MTTTINADRRAPRITRALPVRDLTAEECAALRSHNHECSEERRRAYVLKSAGENWETFFNAETKAQIEAWIMAEAGPQAMPRFNPNKRVPGETVTNGERATLAAKALDAFRDGQEPDEADFSDLLCNLMHYADRAGIYFDAELDRARRNHKTER